MKTFVLRLPVLTTVIVALIALNAASAVAAETDDDQRALIAPIRSRPEGHRLTDAGLLSGGNGRSEFRPL
jgi:hypothetical protein